MGSPKQSAQQCLTSLYEPATTATATATHTPATAMAVHTAQLPHTTPAPTAPHTGMAATVLATLPGMAMATHMAPPTLEHTLEHTVLATHMARHMLALHTAMATHLPMLVLMEAMLVLMAPHTAMATLPHTALHTAPVMATGTHMAPHMLLATIECDRRPHGASALITRDETTQLEALTSKTPSTPTRSRCKISDTCCYPCRIWSVKTSCAMSHDESLRVEARA